VQAEVAYLAKTQEAYVLARKNAGASAKQHSADVTAANDAQIANNKSLNLLRTLTVNGATTLAHVQSMAFVAYTGKPPVPPLVPPDTIDVTLGKKGSKWVAWSWSARRLRPRARQAPRRGGGSRWS
jgi:hypothetical protein